jgi:hypothetical protein
VTSIVIDGVPHDVRAAADLSRAELERVGVLTAAAHMVARHVGVEAATDVAEAAREVVSIFAPTVPVTDENCDRVLQLIRERRA